MFVFPITFFASTGGGGGPPPPPARQAIVSAGAPNGGAYVNETAVLQRIVPNTYVNEKG